MTTMIDIPTQDLPYWMRQARRGRDWGLFLAVLLGLLTALPFIIYPGLSHSNAVENYVYMTADYADAIQEGRLYPRWSPHVLGGFGAPIPNFFPPGAPYSASLIKVLFTDDAVLAVRILFVLTFSLAGITTYAFVRQRTNSATGLLATALYLFSPYLGQTAPHVLGDLSIVLGLALLPFLFWSANRLLIRRRTIDLGLTSLATTSLLVTYPKLAITGIVLCVLLTGWHTLRQSPRRSNWVLVIISLGIGTGLASFYWVPAFLERDLVGWVERLQPSAVSLIDLFSPAKPLDPDALHPSPFFTLGILLPALAIIATVDRIRRRKWLSFHILFLFAGFCLIIVLAIIPTENWLIGVISLVLAISASGLVNIKTRLKPHWQQIVIFAGACIVSTPVLYTPQWVENFGDVQPIDQINYEQRGFGVAVLPPTNPLPSSLPKSLTTSYVLLSGYETGNLNPIAPNSNVRVNLIEHSAHHDRFQITATSSTALDVLTAYFPGWEASAGNEPVLLRHIPQSGLMLLDVPPMSGELTITFGPTPTRQMAWLVSWSSFFILLLLSWRGLPRLEQYPLEIQLLDVISVRLSIVVIILCGVFRLIYVGQQGTTLTNYEPLNLRTEVGLEMITYDLTSETYQPGNQLEIDLYWQTVTALPDNYQAQLTLMNSDSERPVHITPRRSPGFYPTRRWRTFRYVTDPYQIKLPDSPGTYQLLVEVFECNPSCNNKLTFFDADGENLGPAITLPEQIIIAD